jgi:predicted acylesterase/phospholipase RssA
MPRSGPHPDKNVVIAFSSSGGRFPIHLGAADWIESELVASGWNIVARIGTSGGAIAALVRARGLDSHEWLAGAAPVGHHGAIGSDRMWIHSWNMLMHGGLLRSKDIIERVGPALTLEGGGWTEDGDPAASPCYAVAWSITSSTEVVFRLSRDNAATAVIASSSIPAVMSPTEIRNGDLAPELQEKLGVVDHPDEVSAFVDGAVSTPIPIDTAFEIPEVDELIDQARQVAVVGICLDSAGSGYRPDKLVGSALRGGVFYRKILEGSFATLKSAVIEDLEDAMDHGTAALVTIPTGPYSDYSTKFDVSLEEGLEMWQFGFDAAAELCSAGWGDDGGSLVDHLATLVG